MSAWRNGGPPVLAAGAGVTLGLLTVLLRGGSGGSERASLAVLLVAAALVVAVVGPWRAAERGPRRAALDVLLASVSVTLPGLALGKPGALLGGALWVALFGLALVGLTLVVRGRPGQGVATAAGLALVGWPHLGGPLAAGLSAGARATALEATLLTPLPVLGGTFAGADVLRSGRLYGEFPLGQSLPFGYASPTLALEVVAAAALLLALLAAGRARAARRLTGERVPGAAAPLLALGLLLAMPGQAQAQLFPEPSSGDGTPQIGDLSTRVQLGYWPADLTGYLQIDAADGTKGSKFSFRRVLELEEIFVIPTFEVSLAWENGGRIGVQYLEGRWVGEAVNNVPRRYEESVIPSTFIESRYRYRTIALMGEVFIPLTFISDAITLRIITTQRYIKQESRLRAAQANLSDRNSIETLVPTIGAGIDLLIWDVISAYGDVQYLDFTTSWFGGEDGRWAMRYREWKVGVRLELVQHAHIMLEWYSVDTTVEDGRKDKYRQDLSGPRLQVAILF